METKTYLIKEGYLLKSGEISPEYIFESTDIDSIKDICALGSLDKKARAFLSPLLYNEIRGETKNFLKRVEDYHHLEDSFETGDFLRHVSIIRSRKKYKKILEDLAVEVNTENE